MCWRSLYFYFLLPSFILLSNYSRKICGKSFCIVHTLEDFFVYFVTTVSTLTRQKIVHTYKVQTQQFFTFALKSSYEILTNVCSILQHTKLESIATLKNIFLNLAFCEYYNSCNAKTVFVCILQKKTLCSLHGGL